MPPLTSPLHPLVAAWFARRFARATSTQERAWAEIHAGHDVLVSAPTGSGKTLAAFLVCLDRLVRQGLDATLENRIEIVYVSPLKALSNDIHRNLETPLAEIAALATETGVRLPAITAAVRTGDTPAWRRQQMVRRPPHILVTTPESLFILLTADRSRRALQGARTVIVDEIHAVADDKRGAHLALSLARLDDLVSKAGGVPLQRIGLSATVHPIADVAEFLAAGGERPASREGRRDARPAGRVRVIDAGHRRALDVAVEVPTDELGAVATHEMWGEIYDRLAALIAAHRTTLVFVNTRRLAERVAHHLSERLGEDTVLAHHGSLSQGLRLRAEQRLKTGTLRAVVATASLELGIDIGFVDLVCQIGSPRSIGVALQRIGRSGHQVEQPGHTVTPKGRLFATTRDDLIECAALVRAIRTGTLDRLAIPPWPVDILAQQIVAAAACESWSEDALFDLVRRACPYRGLPRPAFDAVIAMLSEGITTRRGRSAAFLHRDQVNGAVRGRRGARLAAITSGGAIPDNASYPVVAEPEGTTVGSVDEDFAVESLAGDVFLLGTTSWRIRRVESGRVRVEDAHGAAPSIPFWRGEAPGRTAELSHTVSELRREVARLAEPADAGQREAAGEPAVEFLMREAGLDRAGAEQAVDYVTAGSRALGALPTDTTVVAERFFDESGGMQLVLHAPFGARINRAWGLSLRKRFCRTFNFELQAAATDNGILISLSDQHSFPLEVIFRFLVADTVEDVLTQAQLDSPMFTARWRWNASRALAILRFAGGRKVPPPIQRMRSDDLLAAVFPDQVACAENLVGEIRVPDHPIVNETVRDCLHEAMDVEGLRAILRGIDAGPIRTVAIDTAEPSPFSHEILNANPYAFLDDAPLEERRARAVQMRRSLGTADEVGALDPAAIAEVAAESWPVVRDADELHDALLTLLVLPPVSEWRPLFDQLRASRRATTLVGGTPTLWVAAERLALVRRIYPQVRLDPVIESVGEGGLDGHDRESATTELVRGWLECSPPLTSTALAERLGLSCDLVDTALARLESEGQILRGRFTAGAASRPDVEWCNRRVLARIHRLTLGRLRREIEPVSAAQLTAFLFRWQHVAPGTQLHGVDGLRAIIQQLQGYEISSAAWEPDVLRRRVAGYDPGLLDQLCLSGEVMWGRLSRHPAFDDAQATTAEAPARRVRARRVRPTRVAPVALLLREDAGWLTRPPTEAGPLRSAESLSHPAAAVLAHQTRRGACFLPEIVRATGRLTSEVEDALWELVAAGLVTADGFDNLRALVDPKRRRGEGRGKVGRPRHAAGRWALLRGDGDEGPRADTPRDPAPPLPARDGAGGAPRDPVEAFARQLLVRWGVVFRDLIARETLAPPWRELLGSLRRLEARGEIRGGRFVAGLVGEQFARPEAIELLRAVRRHDAPPIPLVAAAADPLNLVGVITPGPRVSALAGVVLDVLTGAPQTADAVRPADQEGRLHVRDRRPGRPRSADPNVLATAR